MVNTKHTVNDPKGDIGTSNPRQSAFRRKFFKNERIQDIWPDFQNRNIITGRNIEDDFKPKYRQKMMEPVRALGWSALIPLPTSVYSDLVRYFYCNLEVENLDKPKFSIDSYVRGKHIELNPTILSQIIGVPNEGELIFLDRPSQLKNHVNRAEMNEIVSIRGTIGASHHKDLKKDFRNQHDQHIDEGFSNYTISRGISVDSTDKEDDIDIPPQILGDINMDDVSLDDNLPQSPHPQEDKPPEKALLIARMDSIEQRQILNDKLHELHGTYIDRLGDNYEQLYTQQTEFHQECLDRLKAVQTIVEAESHFQYDPPPFSPHSQALMNLKGTKRSNNF
ncbi:hypothetical protein Acr_00g0052350 [Actinidia rufa]|uniref:Uncharacterized protein n=1 Tax=Actinidia rufa TaxID=165716 RepID=A0A7J0DMZ9_9ERIC|nr:hypothetical protein Acr_00g0052350 [Actinidia rufa]